MSSQKKPELLAPAGNLDKLKIALYYGADAVYIGGKAFSLRSYADNFNEAEIEEGILYAHSLNKKVYAAVNIFAKNADFKELNRYLSFLEKTGADAAIVTDPGVIALAKNAAPHLPLHLSTQANTLNQYSAAFWHKQGITRVVAARELFLQEIKEISAYNSGLELEAFIHGAMCVSYSGRCLLSNYFTERDANRGECVQPCRWNYVLTEHSRHDTEPLHIEEDGRGSYFMNSSDLNLIEHIGDLVSAGVTSFKIEGRMKSEFYVASVVNAYRRAIDEYFEYGRLINLPLYQKELDGISHRPYTKAYLLGDNPATESRHEDLSKGIYDFIAVVLGYENGRAKVEMRNRFKTGDTLEILSPKEQYQKQFTVTEMTDIEGNAVNDAKLVQQTLFVHTPFPVNKGDILRRLKN